MYNIGLCYVLRTVQQGKYHVEKLPFLQKNNIFVSYLNVCIKTKKVFNKNPCY